MLHEADRIPMMNKPMSCSNCIQDGHLAMAIYNSGDYAIKANG